ncbi:ribosomal protein L7/L12 [Chitinophaga skermanii]|nr:ribosomal protein L7/L12 [Chitinophaga skermanii]
MAIIAGDACLPAYYPKDQVAFEKLQSGYRFHGITLEDLTGMQAGQWQPGWFVVALNEMDDPYFVDFSEETKGYPVYFAWHGAGVWEAQLVAPGIQACQALLEDLKRLHGNQPGTAAYLEEHCNIDEGLWQEVYDHTLSQDEFVEQEPVNMGDYVQGDILVIDCGPNKVKVMQFVKALLGLSPQAALGMVNNPPFVLKSGFKILMLRVIAQLESLGAKAEFIPSNSK